MAETIVQRKEPDDLIIALVGNPNVGKSTLFNSLTGMKQHTGNWPGKTVSVAHGRYMYKGRGYVLVDLPGTYSLHPQSEEERVTAEFLSSGEVDCTLVVGDGTCLERNLNLFLQVMNCANRPVFCVNLMDEAERHGIELNLNHLEERLGIPVVGTSAASGYGLETLKEVLRNVASGFYTYRPKEKLERSIADEAYNIAEAVISGNKSCKNSKIDRVVLGKWSGRALLLTFLFVVFWLTIQGANYPSQYLQSLFDSIERILRKLCMHLPSWLHGLLLDGIYGTVTRVVAVMLPPMAIFFPLFTLLEDLGYLPRVAFLMDRAFQRCGSCGKQVLTMAMGFGCNSVGVMGCRIISSSKDRLIATVTNALVPCNGRFPTMIVLISIFFTDHSILGALILMGFLLLSVGMTLVSSFFLHRTVFRGQQSDFVLELPPYRRPQIKKVIIRSLLDRTVFVLGRAVTVAIPAGILIWVLQSVTVQGRSLLSFFAELLNPAGVFMGMNGAILLAFLLSFPANELLLPLVVMIIQGGSMQDLSLSSLSKLLTVGGWTKGTAICVLIFLLFHWPCGTTCLTIKRETGSVVWTIVSIVLPTCIGVLLCHLTGRII